MITIKSRRDLKEWLRMEGLYSEGLKIPEVKPYQGKAWKLYPRDSLPAFLYEPYVIQVSHTGAINGQLEVRFRFEQQGEEARLCPIYNAINRKRGIKVNGVPYIHLSRREVEHCRSREDLVTSINDSLFPHIVTLDYVGPKEQINGTTR